MGIYGKALIRIRRMDPVGRDGVKIKLSSFKMKIFAGTVYRHKSKNWLFCNHNLKAFKDESNAAKLRKFTFMELRAVQ